MIKRLVTLSIAVVLTILALTFNKPSAANVGEMGEGVNAEITELKEFIKFADSLPDFLTMYEKGSKACGKNFASAKVISNGYQNSYHNIGHKETEYEDGNEYTTWVYEEKQETTRQDFVTYYTEDAIYVQTFGDYESKDEDNNYYEIYFNLELYLAKETMYIKVNSLDKIFRDKGKLTKEEKAAFEAFEEHAGEWIDLAEMNDKKFKYDKLSKEAKVFYDLLAFAFNVCQDGSVSTLGEYTQFCMEEKYFEEETDSVYTLKSKYRGDDLLGSLDDISISLFNPTAPAGDMNFYDYFNESNEYYSENRSLSGNFTTHIRDIDNTVINTPEVDTLVEDIFEELD